MPAAALNLACRDWDATRLERRAARTGALLSGLVFDSGVDLLFHGLEVEGRWILHRWVVDGRLGEICDPLLDEHEAPELPGIKVIHVAATQIVQALRINRRRPFEGILADVHHSRHVGRDLAARPTFWLPKKLELEIIDPHGAKLRSGEVEKLTALRWGFGLQQLRLVVTVEMVLIGAVAKLHSLQELVRDVRVAGSGEQRRKPVERREDAVLHRAGLDLARPADDAGSTETALVGGPLGAFEWRHAAVRPSEDLGTVVGRKDQDGVVGLADIVQVLHDGTDGIVELLHAGFLETIVGLAVHRRRILRGQEGPNVHTR